MAGVREMSKGNQSAMTKSRVLKQKESPESFLWKQNQPLGATKLNFPSQITQKWGL